MLSLVLSVIAVGIGLAALGIGLFLYSIHGTRLLRHYLWFAGSIFLFAASFVASALERSLFLPVSPGDLAPQFLLAARALAFLADAAGAIIHVLILPRFVLSLLNRPVPAVATVCATLSAMAIATFAIALLVDPAAKLPTVALSLLLYGSIAFWLTVLAILLRTDGAAADDHAPGTTAAGMRRSLRSFILLSSLFLPFFVLDVWLSAAGLTSAGMPLAVVDNTALPLFVIALSLGSLRFARARLARPALLEDGQITEAARTEFGLSARESEVLEYVLDGFTLPDAALVLHISPKTAENHLYSVYRKTGVTNRIQLFQLFAVRTRETSIP